MAYITSTEILFSPYTDSPGTRFKVTRASSLPRAIYTPERKEKPQLYTFHNNYSTNDIYAYVTFTTTGLKLEENQK